MQKIFFERRSDSRIAPSFVDALGIRFLLPFERDGLLHPVSDVISFRVVEHLVSVVRLFGTVQAVFEGRLWLIGVRV